MATAPSTTGGASALPAAGGTSESTISSWAGPYVTNMLGKAQAIANEPYQVYQGPMTAGESGLQSKVFQGLGNLTFPGNLGGSFSSAGAYQLPNMNAAAPSTAAGGAAPAGPTGIASQYMNPYLQAVLDPQMAELPAEWKRSEECVNGVNRRRTCTSPVRSSQHDSRRE